MASARRQKKKHKNTKTRAPHPSLMSDNSHVKYSVQPLETVQWQGWRDDKNGTDYTQGVTPALRSHSGCTNKPPSNLRYTGRYPQCHIRARATSAKKTDRTGGRGRAVAGQKQRACKCKTCKTDCLRSSAGEILRGIQCINSRRLGRKDRQMLQRDGFATQHTPASARASRLKTIMWIAEEEPRP